MLNVNIATLAENRALVRHQCLFSHRKERTPCLQCNWKVDCPQTVMFMLARRGCRLMMSMNDVRAETVNERIYFTEDET